MSCWTGRAGIVSTSETINVQQTQQERDRLQQLLVGDAVHHGVNHPRDRCDCRKTRVTNMTAVGIQTLVARIYQLPAGGRLSKLDLMMLILLIVTLI